MGKMILNIYILFLVVLSFEPINTSSLRRFRRQINSAQNNGALYDPRSPQYKTPSGSIVGTAYYGIGSDPNYGTYVAKPNRPGGGGLMPITYNSDSQLYGYLIQPSHTHQKEMPHQNNLYNSNYNYNRDNGWQRPNTNNYNSGFYNRNPQGNQGWYGTRGNYRFNKGQSVIAHPCLLFITIAILIFCK